jgi:cytochrome c oxidase assembly protein subunit 11
MEPQPCTANSASTTLSRPHARLTIRLLMLVTGAFGFSIAMVPLYNVLCEVTGLNGKTDVRSGFTAGGLNPSATAAPYSSVDRSRSVRLEFIGTVMPGLPWDMRPLTAALDTHPGEMQQVRYLVRNNSNRKILAQAIPSISPGRAAQYFEKIECFCFQQQALAPGESREMPLAFIVKPGIDRDISQITLSYAFFNIDSEREALGAPQ